MTRRRAIKALKKLKENLVDDNFDFESSWVVQSKSYLADMISPDDFLTKEFTSVVSSYEYFSHHNEVTDEMLATYKNQLSNILDSSIEKIKHIGLINTNSNFLSRISDGMLTAIFIGSVTALLTAGTSYGKFLSDTQNIELRREVKDLKDSLQLFRPTLQKANPIPQKDADTTRRKK